MKILVLNFGSSSQKSCLYEIHDPLPPDPPEPIWQAKVEWSGEKAEVDIRTANGTHRKTEAKIESNQAALGPLLETMWSGDTQVISGPSDIETVGHRVVSGGSRYQQPTLITPEVKAAIAEMSKFAPLHNRAELAGMEAVEKLLGPVPQIAVFDTGYHSHMPQAAYVYPGPYEWLEDGIRRFGFHGINHQYCAERAAEMLAANLNSLKLVTCHLGSGCSLAAIEHGHSVDTTMGFTPLEGLMMGTRSGSVDPGILTYLLRQRGYTGERLDELLNKKSGLLGISGLSSDMREIVAAMNQGHARAKLAFDIFVHRLRSGIGAMAATLGGLDVLVFTAGIGENSPEVRAAACAEFGLFGLELDPDKNARGTKDQDRDLSSDDSVVNVLVIRAQEDWAIARDCWKLRSRATAAT